MKDWRKALYLFSSAVIIIILAIEITPLNPWLTLPLVKNGDLQKSDVIIVLGGGIKKDGSLTDQTQERVREGVSLLQNNYASYLLFSGGQAENRHWPESDKMAGFALSLRASPEKLLKETLSKNTYENAVNSLTIMENRHLNNAIIVTSPYHTKRACSVFVKLKAEISCWPVEKQFIGSQNPWDKILYFKQIIREYGALILFRLKGYI